MRLGSRGDGKPILVLVQRGAAQLGQVEMDLVVAAESAAMRFKSSLVILPSERTVVVSVEERLHGVPTMLVTTHGKVLSITSNAQCY